MIRRDRCRAARGKPSVAAIVAGLLLAGSAAGAGAQPAPPLHLKVRPPAADILSGEARLRQERLEARMRQNEFLFRSICRTCSRGDRFESEAPFHPHETLRGTPAPGAYVPPPGPGE